MIKRLKELKPLQKIIRNNLSDEKTTTVTRLETTLTHAETNKNKLVLNKFLLFGKILIESDLILTKSTN